MNCDMCKRRLQGTIHTREDYRIDFYRLWTGKTEQVVFKENGEQETRFLRIEEPAIVTLCVNCFSTPQVAEALNRFESPL